MERMDLESDTKIERYRMDYDVDGDEYLVLFLHRKGDCLRFEDLYIRCCNLMDVSNMLVLEEGKKAVEAKLEYIYNEIYDRQVIWFSVENDNTIIIKLKGD